MMMASRLAKDYGGGFIRNDANLSADFEAYRAGEATFAKYLSETYDNTEDNWKLHVIDGKILMEWDDENDIKIKDENGNWVRVAGDGDSDLKVYKLSDLLGLNNSEKAQLEERFVEAGGAVVQTAPGKFKWTVGADFMPLGNGTTLGAQLGGQAVTANIGFTVDVTDILMWRDENGRGFVNTGNSETDILIEEQFDISLYNSYRKAGQLPFSSINRTVSQYNGNIALEMSFDEWRGEMSYRYLTRERQAEVEILNQSYLNNFESQLGKPYYFGGGNMEAIRLNPPNEVFYNNDPWGIPIGHDCCGGVMWSIRDTLGDHMNVSPNDPKIWATLPAMAQNEIFKKR